MDSALIPDGVKRCPIWQFGLAIVVVGAVLLWGVFAMLLVWIKGLNQTNMNNAYGFALWIWADLGVIALGGGAFFTGLMRYIFGKDELKHIIYCRAIGHVKIERPVTYIRRQVAGDIAHDFNVDEHVTITCLNKYKI